MMLNMNNKTTPQWMWWWFRFGVGLAAALAGAAVLAFLLWRLWKLAKWFRLPREERTGKKAAKEHLLTHVSGRGRTAYLILCFESALTKFGQKAEDWEWVLQRLWALTEAAENGGYQPLFTVVCLLPVNVLPYETYEAAKAAAPKELMELWDAKEGLPEDRFQPLRDLYAAAGWRLCVLEALLTAIYKLAALSWPGHGDRRRELEIAEEAEALMQNWAVPLPQGACLAPIQRSRHNGWGPSFAGVRMSTLLRTRTAEQAAQEAAWQAEKDAALEKGEK